MRQRDPKLSGYEKHKKPVDRHKTSRQRKYLAPRDFKYDEETKKLICPAGEYLYVANRNFKVKNYRGIAYAGQKTKCRVCPLRAKCLRNPKSPFRQVHMWHTRELQE